MRPHFQNIEIFLHKLVYVHVAIAVPFVVGVLIKCSFWDKSSRGEVIWYFTYFIYFAYSLSPLFS